MEILKERKKVYFCSDLHFGHKYILKFRNNRRQECGISEEFFEQNPEESVKIHNEYLMDKWNSHIGRKDVVYHLGDFSFSNMEETEKILNKLHGEKFMIIGNHDKAIQQLPNYFKWIGSLKEAKFTKELFPFLNDTFTCELCHYPMVAWNRRLHGSTMVHGHTHGEIDQMNIDSEELRLDVGYDGKIARENDGFVEVEKVYEYFMEIVKEKGFDNFKDYVEWKASKDGVRY